MRARSIIPAPCAGVSSQWRDRDLFHLSPEQLITALKPLDTVQDVVKQYLDPNHTSDTVLLDKDAYEEEFWVDAPNVISNFVALEFAGDHQIRYFVQGAKIYVDARKEAGLFLILA